MAKRNKPSFSPEKLAETTGKKDVDELTEQELDKISGAPINPPNHGLYVPKT